MRWHLETEIVAIAVLLIVLFDAQRRLNRSKKRDVVFLICLISGIFSSLVDIADSCIASFSNNVPLLYAFRTLYFLASGLPAVIWLIFLAAVLYEDRPQKIRTFLAIAIAGYTLYFATLMVNLGTGWMFSFTEAGENVHGPIYGLTYAFCAFYTLFFIALLLANAKKIASIRVVLVLSSLPLVIWAGLILEYFMPQWLMLGPCYMIAILIAYFSLQNQSTEEALDRLASEANTDPLTGLANRAGFEKKISAILASSRNNCAMVLVDIDGLKGINDTLGHPLGDEAIYTIARLLKENLIDAAIVARIGGDEFAVAFQGKAIAVLDNNIQRFLSELGEMKIGNDPSARLPLRCSIGIAIKTHEKNTLATLYREADVALYSVKRSGKASFAYYDSSMEGAYQNPNQKA